MTDAIAATLDRLGRFGIKAMTDIEGNIILPDIIPDKDTGQPLTLPPDKMNLLLEDSCAVCLKHLDEDTVAGIIVAMFRTKYGRR